MKPYSAALASVNLVTLAFSDYAKANGCSEMVVVVWQEYQADSDIRAALGSVTGGVSVLLLALRDQKHHAFSKETVTTSTNKCEICLIPQGIFTLYFKIIYTQKKSIHELSVSCVLLHLHTCEHLRACVIVRRFVYECMRTLQQRF